MNEKIDVYSFGVILLELTTGKEANYGDEHSSLAEWAKRQIQFRSSIEEVLDKEIMGEFYIDEMSKVFRLGVMCTATLPSSRPSMKEVLHILQKCSNPNAFEEKHLKSHFDVVPLLHNSKSEHRLHIDNDIYVDES